MQRRIVVTFIAGMLCCAFAIGAGVGLFYALSDDAQAQSEGTWQVAGGEEGFFLGDWGQDLGERRSLDQWIENMPAECDIQTIARGVSYLSGGQIERAATYAPLTEVAAAYGVSVDTINGAGAGSDNDAGVASFDTDSATGISFATGTDSATSAGTGAGGGMTLPNTGTGSTTSNAQGGTIWLLLTTTALLALTGLQVRRKRGLHGQLRPLPMSVIPADRAYATQWEPRNYDAHASTPCPPGAVTLAAGRCR